MLSLYTTIPPKYIEKSRLKDYFFKGYDTKTGKDLPIKISIVDIINNAEMLFGMFKSKMAPGWRYKQNDILEMCQENESIKKISEYIIKNIKVI